ncbi:DNA repair protein RecO [Limnoraphis robusta]|uniref:DNA repair protein RecO n=1 Tax=Limnoraphis robusta CCNP1315 TaxID=3110306 RepID=A0ABU5TR96_9CYAN|nr:DNA repair protein RecO [Limnoraphis robusta]MEA5498442.1 DNA repair protein RecO [Limnoraphis robusta BA-68 BA1]MEA5517406.1 DNA repair protein RecO [Limnoraphis robusta CCNP1315]MEA5546006.1 DNA repair protein RecO [Limnoraphis robusta CCNP1324]
MNRTYTATGINLKGTALGESDRILTILTPEYGLIRAVAPGTRKPRSKLGGRCELFVVNELLLSKGRSLDRITQADMIKSYGGLSQNLGKLAASQYLAELVLLIALSEQPQEELFLLFNEHLERLENLSNTPEIENITAIIASLTQGMFHLLAWTGVAPQVQHCCLTQRPLVANFSDPDWRVGFSLDAGGTISLEAEKPIPKRSDRHPRAISQGFGGQLHVKLSAVQLAILQRLAHPQLSDELEWELKSQQRATLSTAPSIPLSDWVSVERLLRRYAEYQLGRAIRSAALIDTYVEQFQLSYSF